jgi:hypothetical protein
MIIEILYFDGCPNYQPARALIEEVAVELGIVPKIRMVQVLDLATAEQLRFLGSPTIRVEGHDVEVGAESREQFTLACRVYRLDSGLSGLPHADWIRAALSTARS